MKHTGPGWGKAWAYRWRQVPAIRRARIRWEHPEVKVVRGGR